MWNNIRYQWPLHFALLLTNWLPDNVIFLRLRGFLARPFFASCGKDLRLGRGLTFYNSCKITIGSHVYVAKGNWISAADTVEIGDEVMFGPGCIVSSGNHTRIDNSFRYGPPQSAPIRIGKGAWIAGNSTITGGSFIGEGTLIGANSLVRGEIPPNVMYGGVPGKVLKQF
jgi:acetyltransferase-like isoleucine patch superfamily enzyme